MELLLDSEKEPAAAVSFWRNPTDWLREKNLSSGFWIFFSAAFFFDAGFAVYIFLFNLYLLDFHFNERAIGLVNGALTLGALVGTLPAGALGRRFGARAVLLFCFIASPLLGVARALWVWEPAQIALAFITGAAMCSWTVTFLPAVSRLTTKANRTSAISLIFSVGVGTSALGGAICGYLPQWLTMTGSAMQPAAVKRLILLVSCAVAAAGIFPVFRLRMPAASPSSMEARQASSAWRTGFRGHAFLWRFLLCMALWSAILAAFNAFGNVYLSRGLHIPIAHIGMIFSIAQLIQLGSGLLVPVVLRRLGMLRGIFVTQFAAALTLGGLATVHQTGLAIGIYLAFSAAQWMSSPGLYSLLMNETPDAQRTTAASATMFANSLVSSVATAGVGILFTQFGYPRILLSIAACAVLIALMSRLLLSENKERGATRPAPESHPALID
jgi:predicted MFS family arabinose efflux permease